LYIVTSVSNVSNRDHSGTFYKHHTN